MPSSPAHVAPPDPAKRRRRITRLSAAAAVAVALGGSGVYVATANAEVAEVDVPGRLQAENWSAQQGARTESTADADGGQNVAYLADGDWIRYDNVEITGAALTARVAADNKAGGAVELHLGSPTGTLLASFPVASTGGWQKWTTVSATAASVPAGAQTLVAVMKSDQKQDFVNLNWFTLGGVAASPSASPSAPVSPSAPASASASASASPSASASASASATPSTSTGAGWVPVDEAKWQAELAAFKATKAITPIPGDIVRVPEFQTNCAITVTAPDDPIVFPNMPGASHMHEFFGPSAIDASTTSEDLLTTSTKCDAPGDNSAYWVPQLTKNGAAVVHQNMAGTSTPGMRVYYGSRLEDPSTVVPFPPGLRMVQGNAKLQEATPAGKNGQFWCAGSAEIGRSADGNWPTCATGGNLIFQLTFQDCWDGKHIDSPDHKSHMGPAVDGKCQGAYPVAVPNLSFMVSFQSLGGDGLALASGLPSSMHGDFVNAWQPEKLAALVKTCINQKAKCGTTPGW